MQNDSREWNTLKEAINFWEVTLPPKGNSQGGSQAIDTWPHSCCFHQAPEGGPHWLNPTRRPKIGPPEREQMDKYREDIWRKKWKMPDTFHNIGRDPPKIKSSAQPIGSKKLSSSCIIQRVLRCMLSAKQQVLFFSPLIRNLAID